MSSKSPMNIIDYVRFEKRAFNDLAFSEVDSLVLSTFCYFNFESNRSYFPAFDSSLSIAEIADMRDPDKLYICTFNSPESESGGLMYALAASPRFSDIAVTFFCEESSRVLNKQFCAMTFLLPDGSAYLAFRGTDESIAGWREDFELSFKDITSSEALAYDYALRVAEKCMLPLRFGGHSKGGTLAEFASLLVDEDIFERVISIYSHEGPGFVHMPSARINTNEYAWKLRKTVVEQSVLGMMFETRKNLHIVSAQGTGFIQHSPFYWDIEGGSFVFCNRLNAVADFFNAFFNSWMLSKSYEERSVITKAFFEPLTMRGVSTVSEVITVLHKRPLAVIRAIIKADPAARKYARTAFAQLPSAAKDELRKRLGKRRMDALDANKRRNPSDAS